MKNWQNELDKIVECAHSGADAKDELTSNRAWVKIRVPLNKEIPVKLSLEDAKTLRDWIVSCSENLALTAEENLSEWSKWMCDFHEFNREVGPKLMELEAYIHLQKRKKIRQEYARYGCDSGDFRDDSKPC